MRPRRSSTGFVRTRLLPPLLAALVALGVGASAAAKPTPAEQAQQARAREVLGEIQGLDARLEGVVQAWDGANLQLARLDGQVRSNRRSLRIARRTLTAAQARLAKRLVVLYKNGEPSAVDVLVGATTLSELIDRIEAANDISSQDRRIAVETAAAASRYERRQQALRAARRHQQHTVAQLAARRTQIEAGLAQRQRLLASIRTQIVKIRAAERAREAKLAAEARVRIAREQRALAAARAKAAHQATVRTAKQQAAAKAPAQTQTAQPAPAPAAPQPAPAPPTTTASAPAAAPPAAPSGAGHPEAAAIAARYLGVPYRWGGASPAGFDCSGLVSYVYAQLGISLPHYTVAQWNATIPISRGQLQPGDLVFFDSLGHVGIYIGGNQFIHAPHTGDVVRVSSLGESWYASHFDGARRVP
jgi:cell wall-associated NlpC family hydrolase